MKELKNIQSLVQIAVMAAVICVMSPWAFPVPVSAVPITFGTLAVYIASIVLGRNKAFLAVTVYLLIGIAGLPVFSGFSGGIGKFVGPTGGYLVGYLMIALIAGSFADKWPKNVYLCAAGILAGTLLCYALGTAWLAYSLNLSAHAAIAAGVMPFIYLDSVKIAASAVVGVPLRKAVFRAQLNAGG